LKHTSSSGGCSLPSLSLWTCPHHHLLSLFPPSHHHHCSTHDPPHEQLLVRLGVGGVSLITVISSCYRQLSLSALFPCCLSPLLPVSTLQAVAHCGGWGTSSSSWVAQPSSCLCLLSLTLSLSLSRPHPYPIPVLAPPNPPCEQLLTVEVGGAGSCPWFWHWSSCQSSPLSSPSVVIPVCHHHTCPHPHPVPVDRSSSVLSATQTPVSLGKCGLG
jgi:hypothetical protein